MKKYLISLVNREMQIKTTGMVNIKKSDNKYWWECGETKALLYCAEPGGLPSMGSHRVGHDWSDAAAAAASSSNVKWCSHFGKTVWQIFKDRVTVWPSSTHPRHIPKRTENTCPHINLYRVFTVALFIMTRETKEPKCSSSDEWIK